MYKEPLYARWGLALGAHFEEYQQRVHSLASTRNMRLGSSVDDVKPRAKLGTRLHRHGSRGRTTVVPSVPLEINRL